MGMREDLFHKIWEIYFPEFNHLKTSDGQSVQILHPGTLNTGDGPDFSNASIKLGSLVIHGDIELHLRCSDWYAHNHQTDINYNKVILHIVLEESGNRSVRRADKTYVSTVSLGAQIPDKLIDVIRKIRQKSELACHGFIADIHPDVLKKQIITASEQYFEQKIRQVKEFYDPHLPISRAWVRMVFLSWCDGLGIPKNRENMVEMGQFIWERSSKIHIEHILAEMKQFSQLDERTTTGNGKSWDFSGSHPGNGPPVRLKNVANLLYDLNKTPFKEFALNSGLDFIRFFSSDKYCGKQRRSILLQITLMPAISVLGELLGREELHQFSKNYWLRVGFNAPNPIKKPFQNAGISHIPDVHGPGYVYQLKHYCSKLACKECFIFKSTVRG
jgi:hypothetical protein